MFVPKIDWFFFKKKRINTLFLQHSLKSKKEKEKRENPGSTLTHIIKSYFYNKTRTETEFDSFFSYILQYCFFFDIISPFT